MRRPHFRPSKDFLCAFCGGRIRWAGDDIRYGIRLKYHAHKKCYPKAASSEAANPFPFHHGFAGTSKIEARCIFIATMISRRGAEELLVHEVRPESPPPAMGWDN
jgi:hypothetical protein